MRRIALTLGLLLPLELLAAAETKAIVTERSADYSKVLPVFPGAEGFGANTLAGRGGKVIKVTSLAATGAGSLKEAVETKGPRVIVFEVGGIIDLNKTQLEIKEPFATIAGQTAPAPGITLIRGGIGVRTNDVLIQHICVRPGDAGEAKGSGWDPDGMSVGSYEGAEVFNVFVDHCSFSWSVDECASISGKEPQIPHDVTYRRCIIAEGLSVATHAKGEHSMGTLVMNGSKRVSLIGNFYAHNYRRNPYFKESTTTLIVNNLIYNPGEAAMHVSQFSGNPPYSTIIGNVMVAGASTQKDLKLVCALGGSPKLFLKDNICPGSNADVHSVLTSGGSGVVKKWNAAHLKSSAEASVTVTPLTILPASQIADGSMLKHVGAFPARRDAVDKRIIEDFKAGRGRIINSQNEVGGYPKYAQATRALKLPDDPNGDSDGDGYTNIEEFLHAQAAEAEGR